MDNFDNGDHFESYVQYKSRTNAFIETLLLKDRDDSDYIKVLEEKVVKLENNCREKDGIIKKFSNDSQRSANEAEYLMEKMFSRIVKEVKCRRNAEVIASQLQEQNSLLLSNLKLSQEALKSSTIETSTQLETKERIIELTNLVTSFYDDVLQKDTQLKNLELKRTMEMKAIVNVVKLFHEKLNSIMTKIQNWQEREMSEKSHGMSELDAAGLRIQEEHAFLRLQQFNRAPAGFMDDTDPCISKSPVSCSETIADVPYCSFQTVSPPSMTLSPTEETIESVRFESFSEKTGDDILSGTL